jgi:hypothetical protein
VAELPTCKQFAGARVRRLARRLESASNARAATPWNRAIGCARGAPSLGHPAREGEVAVESLAIARIAADGLN